MISTSAEARRRVLSGDPAAVRAIDGSFALVASRAAPSAWRDRWIGRCAIFSPSGTRGRRCIVADRIDTLHAGAGRREAWTVSSIRATRAWCRRTTSSSSRSSAAPIRIRPTRASSRRSAARCPPISTRSAGATSARWPTRSRSGWRAIDATDAGGADRRLLLGRHRQRLGVPRHLSRHAALGHVAGAAEGVRARIVGDGPDVEQARAFLVRGRAVAVPRGDRRRGPTISTSRDASACSRTTRRSTSSARRWACGCAAGIRERYPEWRHLADGDGGDENLKDYPIEENPELTIRSVVDNLMLYQEGWGVGRIKHSLTYSGGLSRSYVRTYAPARRYGFDGFSPYTRPERDRGGGRRFRSRS